MLSRLSPLSRRFPKGCLQRAVIPSLWARSYSEATSASPVHIAIVGAGPAGYYCAARILRRQPSAHVALFDALPVPYGLVRYGVAPDHPEVKNVESKFEQVSADPRVRLFLNTPLGESLGQVSINDLKRHFHAVILSYGAGKDKELSIPGESLGNVLGARAFVGWYNGAPEHQDLSIDLQSSDTAVVIGQGNVALDVARILLSPVDDLRRTDMTEVALDALSTSKIRHVHVVGRRTPRHVAFTSKEAREMVSLKDVDYKVKPASSIQDALADSTVGNQRALKRLLSLLDKPTPSPASTSPRSWTLHFLSSPVEILGSTHIEAVRLAQNQMEGDRAVQTEEAITLPTGLLVRSIGYKCFPLPTIPFDSRHSIVPNTLGRVLDKPDGEILPGMYVAGWLKRGPSGTIASTLMDANETAEAVLADLPGLQSRPGPTGAIEDVLKVKGVAWVGKKGWSRIDATEVAKGEAQGKPREKLTNVDDMMVCAQPHL